MELYFGYPSDTDHNHDFSRDEITINADIMYNGEAISNFSIKCDSRCTITNDANYVKINTTYPLVINLNSIDELPLEDEYVLSFDNVYLEYTKLSRYSRLTY